MYRYNNQPVSDRLVHRSVTASLSDKLTGNLLQGADEFLILRRT